MSSARSSRSTAAAGCSCSVVGAALTAGAVGAAASECCAVLGAAAVGAVATEAAGAAAAGAGCGGCGARLAGTAPCCRTSKGWGDKALVRASVEILRGGLGRAFQQPFGPFPSCARMQEPNPASKQGCWGGCKTEARSAAPPHRTHLGQLSVLGAHQVLGVPHKSDHLRLGRRLGLALLRKGRAGRQSTANVSMGFGPLEVWSGSCSLPWYLRCT